jgi:hypothetical protein
MNEYLPLNSLSTHCSTPYIVHHYYSFVRSSIEFLSYKIYKPGITTIDSVSPLFVLLQVRYLLFLYLTCILLIDVFLHQCNLCLFCSVLNQSELDFVLYRTLFHELNYGPQIEGDKADVNKLGIMNYHTLNNTNK